MAQFKSRYAELGFYVNGDVRYFSGGRYVTDDEDAIAVLDSITDAERVNEEPEEAAPKTPAPRKADAKASGK